MSDSGMRRLTLKDVMTLVAATGLGIAWARGGWDWMYLSRLAPVESYGPVWMMVDRVVRGLPSLLPCLATVTLAVVCLRMTPPRPRLRRVALQPGASACLAATLAIMTSAVDFGMSSFWWRALRGESMTWDVVPSHAMEYLFQAAPRAAIAVGASWLLLCVSRRSKPERSWIDRLGRILGVLWILMAVCRGWAELSHVMQYGPPTSGASILSQYLIKGTGPSGLR
jgi:hypothetical protein